MGLFYPSTATIGPNNYYSNSRPSTKSSKRSLNVNGVTQLSGVTLTCKHWTCACTNSTNRSYLTEWISISRIHSSGRALLLSSNSLHYLRRNIGKQYSSAWSTPISTRTQPSSTGKQSGKYLVISRWSVNGGASWRSTPFQQPTLFGCRRTSLVYSTTRRLYLTHPQFL